MTKRKERLITQLYHVTEEISKAEITPVLKGNCRIQGPMDEANSSEKKTSSSQPEKKFSRRSATGKVGMRAESGTCNVCAAPCSSCRHFNESVSRMEIKAENELSDEVSGINSATRFSFKDSGVMPSFKKRARSDRKPAASETSNLVSASSSHDSVSENAESKPSLKTFVTNENVKMHLRGSLGVAVAHDQLLTKPQGFRGQSVHVPEICDVVFDEGQKTIANQHEVQNGCGDDVSCVSGANSAHIPDGDLSVDVDGKNISCSAASVSSISPEGCERKCQVQSYPDKFTGCQDERQDNCNNSKALSMVSEEYKQTEHLISSSKEMANHKPEPSEFPLSKDCVTENRSPSLITSLDPATKSISCKADKKCSEKNLCCQHQVESSVCTTQYVESSSEKLEISFIGAQCSDTRKSGEVPKIENSTSSLIGSTSCGTSINVNGCLEAGIVLEMAEPAAETVEHCEINEHIEKSTVSLKVSDSQHPLKSQSEEASDGSDIVEDDVKVCDICGDAGREDLLAICSKCNDGAEHTYCMHTMMDKVPESDWFCEVCQMKEVAANEKKGAGESVAGNLEVSCSSEKNKMSDSILDSLTSPKLDTQFLDKEMNRATLVAPSPRLSSKRHSDNLEVPPAPKRQALESSVGSPKPSSPNKTNTLSRESSFKNMDKGKVKPILPVPSLGGSSAKVTTRPPSISVQNSSKIQHQFQSPRDATLLKSCSFNASNSKPKVKMVQEDPPQKSKHPFTSGSRKEGLIRTISKSSSFNICSSHSNSTESKSKVHSSNLSRSDDLRTIKLGKDRNIIERKNSFKSDRVVSPFASTNASSPKDEHKVYSRGKVMPLPSTKLRDPKAVQADARLNITSKSTSLLPRKGSESPKALAGRRDFKRQSSLVSRGGGHSSFSANFAEEKASQVNSEDVYAANLSCNAGGPKSNSDLVLQDGYPSLESMDQDTHGEEPSLCQSRQSLPAAGKSISCHKCKEIGHAAQFCPNGSVHMSILEATTARSSREMMNRSSKSNDPNEVAFTKNSGKSKTSELPDPLSMSSTEEIGEIAPKGQLSNSSNCIGHLTSSDGPNDTQDILMNSAADSSSTALTSVNHDALPHGVVVCGLKAEDRSQSRLSSCDLQNQDSSVFTPSKLSYIPEQDYIWQGGFEVQRCGRHIESFDGIQAHLSTCVSPKVLDVVNKLPFNIQLEEVSRSSTWPTQFQNFATEDNIALYFFATDVERSYQSLVENMMKNDLALKGILDGIELLIFPSNQLCEKSTRWNMLYFLWGVFRAKRVNISEKIDGSLKNLSVANLNVMPMEEEVPSYVSSVDKDMRLLGRSLNEQEAIKSTSLMQFPPSSSSGGVDARNYREESSSDQKCLGLETKSSLGQIDLDSNSLLMIPTREGQFTNIKGNDISKLRHACPESEEEMELGQRIQEVREEFCLTKSKTVLLNNSNHSQENFPSPSPQKQEACPGLFKIYPDEASSLSQEARVLGSGKELVSLDRPKDQTRHEVTHGERVKNVEGLVNADLRLKDDSLRSELVKNKHVTWDVNFSRKRPHSTMVEMVSQVSGESSACTGQLMPWKENLDDDIDGENECKKKKMVYSDASQMLGLASSFKEHRLDGPHDCTIVRGSSMSTERHFFPMELAPVKDVGVRCNSIPVHVISSDDEEQLEFERPNLDLALGGEKRSPKQKMWPMFELLAKNKIDRGKHPEIMTDNGEDDSSLSLSLAVPFSSRTVQAVKPVTKPDPKKNHLDTSLILFGGFSGT